MTVVADESVDKPIVDHLRPISQAIISIAEEHPGSNDEQARLPLWSSCIGGQVLALCAKHHALLLTADKDFGESVFRQQRVHSGIVLVRLSGLSPERKALIVAEALARHGNEIYDAFTVITASTVRIRKRKS